MSSHRVFADPAAANPLTSRPAPGVSGGGGAPRTGAAAPAADAREETGSNGSAVVPNEAPPPASPYEEYVGDVRGGVVPVIVAGPYRTGGPPSSMAVTPDSRTPGSTLPHAVPEGPRGVSASTRKLKVAAKGDTDDRVFLRNPFARGSGSGDDDDSSVAESKNGSGGGVAAVPVTPLPEPPVPSAAAPLSQERVQELEEQQGKGGDEEDDEDDALNKETMPNSFTSVEEGTLDGRDSVCCRVSSLVAVAVLMCLGTVVVGLLGFLPFYFIGARANSRTTEFLLAEAAKGVTTITQNSVAMLPAFVNIIAFNYVKWQVTPAEDTNLPTDAAELALTLVGVLTKFKYSIQFLMFVVEDQLYTSTVYRQNYTSIWAAYNDTPGVSPMYLINETTDSFIEPRQSVGNVDFSSVLSDPVSAMQIIVIPWSRNMSNHTQWMPDNAQYTSIYFDYVLPLKVGDRLGYCEAGLPASNVINETYRLLPALREHGRIVILDPRREIVIENSWNQSSFVRTSGGDEFYHALKIGEIDDDVMNAAVSKVNKSGGFELIMRGRSTLLVTFKFQGGDANLNLTRLTDEYGLDILLGVVVVRADFEKAFVTARGIVIGVTVGVVVLAAVVALGIAYVVVKPLKELGPELQRASALEISADKQGGRGGCCGGLFITEIRDIQMAYRRLKRSLREMKSYVPQAMMTSAVDSEGDGSRNAGGGGGAGGGGSGGAKRDLRLNTKIFKEQINEFKKKSCTMVLIELRCAPDADSIRAMIDVITETVGQYSGCLEQIGLNHMLVSFGAHAPLPLHAAKGCNFILDVFYRVPEQLRNYLVCLVDNSEFMVGTCGARNRNSRVVFGVGHLVEITKVLWDIGCHIAATPTTSSHMPPVQSLPVECVQLQGSKSHTVLCELYPPPPADRLKQVTADFELMRDAFSHMCCGEYQMAMTNYSAVSDKSRAQMQRLLRICQQRCAVGDRSNYVRPTEDVYHFAYRADEGASTATSQSGDTRQLTTGSSEPASQGGARAAGAALALAGAAEGGARFGAGVFGQAAAGDSFAAAALPAVEDPAEASTSCPLFDMFANSAASSDGSRSSNAVDVELPLTLVDTGGGKWSRSINKISDGAFSVVYLGMSEDGVQVAIKCIPRRRRDIKEDHVRAEMRMMAELRHPNIVQYIGFCATQTHLSIIMEYVPGGSLYAVIENFGKLSATVVRRFMTDIVNGLSYLHSGNIVHCDVKPHNMLLGVNGVCKLSDFGSTVSEATDFSGSRSGESHLRGTALYMAPEVARGEKATQPSDIYSLGISFLEMLLGRLPWRWSSSAPASAKGEPLELLYRSDARFVQMLSRGHVEAYVPDSLDRDAYRFARACCQADPKKRLTAQELLSNPFLI